MTPTPIFVINPKSHKVDINGSTLSRVAIDYGDIPIVFFDGSTPLSDLILPLLLEGRDTIYVEGGDGTVLAALTACFEYYAAGHKLPQIAILPGGSTNLAYKKLGLHVAEVDALKRSLSRGQNQQQAHAIEIHNALLVETSETTTPLVGFLLSTGSLARLMLYTQQNLHGKTRGSVSIARAILQLGLFPQSTKYQDGLPVVRPSQFTEISPCGSSQTTEQAFSLFSTFRELSLGLSPFWARGDHPIGHTQAAWPIKRLRSGIAKAVLSKSSEGLARHGLTSRGCEDISFKCDGPVVFDGEELSIPADQTFKVSVSPPLEFLR
jgi:hypothetical protein